MKTATTVQSKIQTCRQTQTIPHGRVEGAMIAKSPSSTKSDLEAPQKPSNEQGPRGRKRATKVMH